MFLLLGILKAQEYACASLHSLPIPKYQLVRSATIGAKRAARIAG